MMCHVEVFGVTGCECVVQVGKAVFPACINLITSSSFFPSFLLSFFPSFFLFHFLVLVLYLYLYIYICCFIPFLPPIPEPIGADELLVRLSNVVPFKWQVISRKHEKTCGCKIYNISSKREREREIKRIFGYFAASVVRGVEEEEKRAAEAEAGEKREAIPWS